MKKVKIHRVETEAGNFGQMIIDGVPFCLTLERPWLDNRINVSCIPPGEYICERVTSPRFKETFEVMNVQGRTHILFHVGNVMVDSLGCILLGLYHGTLNGKPAIMDSGVAIYRFMTAMENIDRFELKIVGGKNGMA